MKRRFLLTVTVSLTITDNLIITPKVRDRMGIGTYVGNRHRKKRSTSSMTAPIAMKMKDGERGCGDMKMDLFSYMED